MATVVMRLNQFQKLFFCDVGTGLHACDLGVGLYTCDLDLSIELHNDRIDQCRQTSDKIQHP